MHATTRPVLLALLAFAVAGCCVNGQRYAELVADFGQDLEGVGGAMGHADRAMALFEAGRAASEARMLAIMVVATRPDAALHFRDAADALDRVADAIDRELDEIPWYQRAFVAADAAREAITPADLCEGTSGG